MFQLQKLFVFPLVMLCSTTLVAQDAASITTDLPQIHAEPPVKKELHTADHLIGASQKTLNTLVELKSLIKHYYDLEERYLQGSEDNELLYAMAKQAHQILEIIKTHHLAANFSPAFIEELSVISKPVSKRGIPKP